MKKIVALLLAVVMVVGLCACGEKTPATPDDETAKEAIAFCSDVGTINDQSFNQFCFAGVESVAKAKGLNYEYYIPSEDTAEEREKNIRQAITDGATIVVCTGYMYGSTLATAATENPDIKFVGIDITASDVGGTVPANTYLITFKEEQCGYLAGYAAVKDGYTALGFLGGIAVPAVVRFGYGYVQGADAAAKELGVNIGIKYTYGGKFEGDADITAKMEGWYTSGTEVVFACGGGIFTSAVEAATKNNGYVIGVDVDQHYIGEAGVEAGSYTYNPFITSAVKSLQASTESALNTYLDGKWEEIGGKAVQLGIAEGNYVGIPTAEASWGFKTYTTAENDAIVAKIASGEVVVNNSFDAAVHPEVSEFTTVEYID